jgi:hypothetical protein
MKAARKSGKRFSCASAKKGESGTEWASSFLLWENHALSRFLAD